jgi:hypothetical protein
MTKERRLCLITFDALCTYMYVYLTKYIFGHSHLEIETQLPMSSFTGSRVPFITYKGCKIANYFKVLNEGRIFTVCTVLGPGGSYHGRL